MVWKVIIASMVAFSACPVVLAAQGSLGNQEGPTTLTLSAGVARNGTHTWPRAGLSIEHGLGAFIARGEAWAISRPRLLCSGTTSPMCEERRFIRGLSAGGRLQERTGAWHLYSGAGGGIAWYEGRSDGVMYLELGTRYDITEQWGLDVRAGTDVLGPAFLTLGLSRVIRN